MENKPKSSRFETFLFGFTRVFAIIASLIGLIAFGLVIQTLLESSDSTYVSLDEISTKSNAQNASLKEALASPSTSLSTPANVTRYISGDNEKILQGWLDGISEQEQKQEFLDNLAEVIAGAEEADLDVMNTINNYRTIKIARLSTSEMDRYAEVGKRAGLISALFGLVLFISLMGLVLVLLAVERNTRGTSPE